MYNIQSNPSIYVSRKYTSDLIHSLIYSLVPAHGLLLNDDTHTRLLDCHLTYAFNYKFRPRSLVDLTHEDYQINFNIELEKKNLRYERILNEIQFNDSDYESDLDDMSIHRMFKKTKSNQMLVCLSDIFISKQDPIQVYLQACKQYQIHPLNIVIERLNTNTIDLSEMSINDHDLKPICLALRVDNWFCSFLFNFH